MTNRAIKLYQLLRETKRESRLGTLILFVTSRCNAKCETCFYWQELNQPGDMTFAQIERVAHTMPPITDLWLSGGEPTLRRDLVEIIDLFVRHNGVRRVIIPTNALIKTHVCEVVERALSSNPQLDLYLNIALDGYGETHDRIRGVPGNWTKTLDCLRAHQTLRRTHVRGRRRSHALRQKCRLRRRDHHALSHATRQLRRAFGVALSLHGRRDDRRH